VRIAIEKDERWPLLRAGLSVQAIIAQGPGDPQWAEQAAREMGDLETRYNQPHRPDRGGGDPGDQPWPRPSPHNPRCPNRRILRRARPYRASTGAGWQPT